ncbi:MAG: 30S ribosomal protein S16 [Candidatus Kaiserbacteria bacterium]|nr:MAG: 30S ribosomal protein S16 [Candidatus Kaiserbacteria bacterium]
MLKIRLQRTGRTNQPSFRIVVAEHTESPKTGSIVEKVGTYNPKTKERSLAEDRVKYWMSVGAKPSATVHNMLVALGVLNAKKINILPAYKAPAEAAAEAKEEAAEKAAEQEAKAEAKAAHDAEVKAEAETKAEEATAPAEAESSDKPEEAAAPEKTE